MKKLLALLPILLLLITAQPAFAAFPVQQPAPAEQYREHRQTPVAPAPMPRGGGGGSADGFAITSFVTGVLGVPIVPIVFGVLALGDTEYKGLAIAGIVLGALTLLLYAVLIVFLVTAV
jgi:hypothetical protein